MDFHCPAGDSGDPCIYCHWRRNSVAPLELAVAAAVRLAPDHLLASPWTSGAVPHPLRRMGWSCSPRSNMRRRIDERVRQRMDERWEKMTPEEREKFRQGLRGRCSPFEPPEAKPTS